MYFPLNIFILHMILAGYANALPNFTQPLANYKWPSQFVRTNQANIQVLVQGTGPTVVLLPSYGRDGGDDYNYFTNQLVSARYLVLRPHPRGTFESTSPMINVSLADLAADIAAVIDNLGGGKAVVIGHAFGTFLAQVTSVIYPEKIPAIVVAAPGGIDLPTGVAQLPFVAGNTSLPLSKRLEALYVWHEGRYPDVLAMEYTAVKKYGSLKRYWASGDNTQVLESSRGSQWNVSSTRYPERATSVVIADAAHALFPEQPRAIVEVVLPWLKQQSSKL
ncbi:alpha/beta fold family hydrolase [Penicillium concentricum]|uniref:Alpha/beta fold family hydrolase n=1 Tax=Penicillium concentricum TaxID=293559 RepID=A0A9W9VB75_9EURO|nr:alpha/beta fold family hydrolase [Penicillium concentricum]KAJ5373165.1 alpha/beta fold family hydrolase [Penicillium concentricum]